MTAAAVDADSVVRRFRPVVATAARCGWTAEIYVEGRHLTL